MSDERPTVIPFYALRLKDLVHAKGRLVVMCKACHKSGDVDVVPLLHRLGPEHGVKECESRLICSHCKQRGWAMVRMEWF